MRSDQKGLDDENLAKQIRRSGGLRRRGAQAATWGTAPLEKLATDLQPGFACQPSTGNESVPQLRTNNVSRDGSIDLSEVKCVPATGAQIERYSLARGDILFNNTNSPALVGKTAYFDEDGLYLFSNHMTRVRLDARVADPRFVARFLHWSWSQGALRGLVTQWVNQAAINRVQLASVLVPLPPPSEQRRIVEILDQADRLRRLRAEADAKADRILPALYRKLFLTRASEWPTEALGTRLRKSRAALQSGPFGSHLHNSDFVESGPVRVVGIDNVLDGEFSPGRDRRISLEKYAELKKYTLEPGDILVTIMGTVGRCCVFPRLQEPAICTKHVYRIQVDERLDPEYVSATIRYDPSITRQLGASITGQIVAGITSDGIRRLTLPIPPRELQHRFAAHARATAQQCVERRRASGHLRRLFQTLLRDAFSGTLTARWRESHINELLEETERQVRPLGEAP